MPHIHEKIFFSLDYDSFKECLKVCRASNDLFTSYSFKRVGKSVFCEAIHENLNTAMGNGQTQEVKRILSTGMADIKYMTEKKVHISFIFCCDVWKEGHSATLS